MTSNKEIIESTIYDLIYNKKNVFVGAVLNEMHIYFNEMVPTACLIYKKEKREFAVYINPNFFKKLSKAERTAVFHHEILHFTHDHIRRFMKSDTFSTEEVDMEEAMKHNIAADMAINQYITDLPKDRVDVKDWKQKDGTPFPTYQNYEEYFRLIDETTEEEKPKNNEFGKESKPGKGNSINRPIYEKYIGGDKKILDEHNFTGEMGEEEKKQMLEDLKDTFQRAIEKQSFSHSSLPEHIQDLLKDIDAAIQGLDYKKILREAIKKHASHTERESTWYRPNKRYGVVAQGTKQGNLPLLNIYMDTSGSISHTEANEFLSIIRNFLKVGSRKCNLILFHTEIYHKQKYKKNSKFNESDVQCGGTDLGMVMDDIQKNHPDLSIVLTDGYYDGYDTKMTDKIVFIITEQGNVNHPLAQYGKTIKFNSLR